MRSFRKEIEKKIKKLVKLIRNRTFSNNLILVGSENEWHGHIKLPACSVHHAVFLLIIFNIHCYLPQTLLYFCFTLTESRSHQVGLILKIISVKVNEDEAGWQIFKLNICELLHFLGKRHCTTVCP